MHVHCISPCLALSVFKKSINTNDWLNQKPLQTLLLQGLQNICRKHDIQLIIDEVQTGGGATGKMWCHEHFNLEHGADIVTYSKKMLAAGMYHKKELAPKHPARFLKL